MARRGSRAGGAGKPRAGKLVRKAVEALDKPRVRGPNPDLPPVTIKIQRKPFMPKGPFQRKTNALKKLGEEGKLYKATNPVARNDKITSDYRQDLIKRIHEQYGRRNPEFSRRLIDRVTDPTRMHPDHVWELQLGGPDHASNLRFLHARTNTDIGTRQIWPQIQNLTDGTPIRIEVIE
ncbi:endonuclease [Micromonospora sp. NPDC050686]|uniref:endonuclease n=1 Tax=Micromonospora sp. NPDC050686 TaxID=3154631 RepID=UPI003406D34C